MSGFLRVKWIRGQPHNYLVRSYRDPATGRIRQKHLAYLGDHTCAASRRIALRVHLRKLIKQRDQIQRSINKAPRDRILLARFGQFESKVRRTKKSIELLAGL